MKKLIILSLMLCSLATMAQAQETAPVRDRKIAVSLSNMTSSTWYTAYLGASSSTTYTQTEVHNFRALAAVPALLLENSKGNFMEFSLTALSAGHQEAYYSPTRNTLAAVIENSWEVGVRWGYFHRFAKKSTSAWKPMLGLEVTPTAFGLTTIPSQTTEFPSYGRGGALYGNLSGRLLWQPKGRVFAEIGGGLPLMRLATVSWQIDNPAVPLDYQKVGLFEFDMFRGQSSAQVGVGVWL